MAKQLIFGNTPVPYTVSWSGEEEIYLGNCPSSKRLSICQVSNRGAGKPKFGAPHMMRQREAIAKCLCDLCGKSIRNSTKVSLSQARPQGHAASPFDILQVEPLLHRKCAAICMEWCPSLKSQLARGDLKIRQVQSHGCQFALYSEQGVFEAVGVRKKAVSHAKVHLQKYTERNLAWLTR
jgi:hypothetical protein